MEPSWRNVTAGLGPLAPLSPALERAFAYERMQRSLWYRSQALKVFILHSGGPSKSTVLGNAFFAGRIQN
jgi:hypothetical protein